MGYYVNPPNEEKEVFLHREGLEVPKADWDKIPKDSIPVVLINNGAFTAAGIGYDKDEYVAFTDKEDGRPKKIFIVKKLKLKEIGCDNPRTKEEQRSINQDIRMGQMLEEAKNSVKHEFCKITIQ